MKRKYKLIIGGALILGGTIALVDALMQWYEKRRNGELLTWDNFDSFRMLTRSIAGLGLGAGIGYLYNQSSIDKEVIEDFDVDDYLNAILDDENVKSDRGFFNCMLKFRKELKEKLWEEYKDILCSFPEDGGSFAKRTANASTYDLDIHLAFKRSGFNSLQQMNEDVYVTLKKQFGGHAKIDWKSKAIGITFIDHGNELNFDIVPGREINNYSKFKNLNLYVKPESFWQNGSSLKINVEAQRNITRNNSEARRAIRLIKKYVDKNNMSLPSVIIEQCVVEALSENMYGANKSDSENLLNCFYHISNRMSQKTLIDITNSNNNLFDKLSDWEKSGIGNSFLDAMKKIQRDRSCITEIL